MSIVTVRLFARARELAGRDLSQVGLPVGATVADLRRLLAAAHPDLAEFLPRCAIAVEGDFAEDDDMIWGGSEVAVLPPVSGG